MTGEPFWNLTGGERPPEPVPGLFAGICHASHHVYDNHYGPDECARCGYRTPQPKVRFGRLGRLLMGKS